MKAEFEALIKKVTNKSLVSLDTEAEIVLRMQTDKEVVKRLIDLQEADKLVKVVIADE